MSQPNDRGVPAAGDESYDAIVSRLERVVGELESGQLTLEQSIEKFAEGVRLARDASRKLDDAERRVEQLVRSADGGDEAVPLQPPPAQPGPGHGSRGEDKPPPAQPGPGHGSRGEDRPPPAQAGMGHASRGEDRPDKPQPVKGS